jgi:hypothetical protein
VIPQGFRRGDLDPIVVALSTESPPSRLLLLYRIIIMIMIIIIIIEWRPPFQSKKRLVRGEVDRERDKHELEASGHRVHDVGGVKPNSHRQTHQPDSAKIEEENPEHEKAIYGVLALLKMTAENVAELVCRCDKKEVEEGGAPRCGVDCIRVPLLSVLNWGAPEHVHAGLPVLLEERKRERVQGAQ